jgi:glycosyltransferase involved in cell wall biosynthesis
MTGQLSHTNRLEVIARALREKKFKEAERRAVEFLRDYPVNSQAWVLLGEALILQGFKETATRAFERAWLLDPEATWVQSVFSLLAKIKDDDPRLDIEMMMDAPPATVSAAIIVRNEERCIARCLASISEAVDEIIVMDTGSTDRTMQIAQQFPKVKLYTYEWDEDFAAARNRCLTYVTSDWVICIDADEYLLADDIGSIRQAATIYQGSKKPVILRVGIVNQIDNHILSSDYGQARLFQMNKGLRYWGTVYEQIGGPDGPLIGDFYRAAVRIRLLHDGHETETARRNEKIGDRLRKLEHMVEEEPDNPIWLLFYGRETLRSGDKKLALELLLRALKSVEVDSELFRRLEMYMLIVSIYMVDDLLDEAEEACQQALKLHIDFPDAHYWLGVIEMRRAEKLLLNARNDFLQAKSSYRTYRGMVSADNGIGTWKSDEALREIDLKYRRRQVDYS